MSCQGQDIDEVSIREIDLTKRNFSYSPAAAQKAATE
jgi:hypothetical protein